MTIVKHETIELTREEFTVINKCIKLMVTAKKGAGDPILKEEAHQIILALEKFRRNFTVSTETTPQEKAEMIGEAPTDGTTSDYDRGFQDGMKWEHDNPPIRANY